MPTPPASKFPQPRALPPDARPMARVGQMTPALARVLWAPFFERVLNARAVALTVTNLLSSGTQTRLVLRLGECQRGVTAVTCMPMPPFFLARPRRWILDPRLGFAPVISHFLDIKFKFTAKIHPVKPVWRGFLATN
jgi:hypothetical protein